MGAGDATLGTLRVLLVIAEVTVGTVGILMSAAVGAVGRIEESRAAVIADGEVFMFGTHGVYPLSIREQCPILLKKIGQRSSI